MAGDWYVRSTVRHWFTYLDCLIGCGHYRIFRHRSLACRGRCNQYIKMNNMITSCNEIHASAGSACSRSRALPAFRSCCLSTEITQPALSRSIKSLEERLGCSLFDRSRSGVTPTREGIHFLDRGHELLTAANQLQAEIEPSHGGLRDELDLACGLFPAEMTLAPVLRRLTDDLPGLELNVEITDWTQARRYWIPGSSQLMFGELGPAAGFESRVVNRQPLRAIVRPDHPLARSRSPVAEDLFAYPAGSAPVFPLARSHLFSRGAPWAGWMKKPAGLHPAWCLPRSRLPWACAGQQTAWQFCPWALPTRTSRPARSPWCRSRRPGCASITGLAWRSGSC